MSGLRSVIVLVLFVFSFFPPLYSQSGVRDSLLQLLESHPESGPERGNLLIQIGKVSYLFEPQQTEDFAREALAIGAETQDSLLMANANNNIGISFFVRGNLDSALVYCEKAIMLGQEMGDTLEIYTFYNSAASAHARKGNLILGLDRFQKAFEGFKNKGRVREMGIVLVNIGLINFQLGSHQKALEYTREALGLIQSPEVRNIYANALNNMGVIFYEGTEQYDSALYYQKLALEEKLALGMSNSLSTTCTNLADIYLSMEDYAKAWPFIVRADSYARKSENLAALGANYQAMAKYWLGMERLDSARHYIELAEEMIAQTQDLELITKVEDVFAEVEEQSGNYEAALKRKERFISLRDSLLDKQKSLMLAELETQYQLGRHKEENQQLREKDAENEAIISRQSTVTWLIVLALILLSLTVFLLLRNLRQNQRSNLLLSQKNRQIESKQLELQKKNEELAETIREKDSLIGIVAHDLKSPLSKVQGLAQLLPLSGELNEEQQDILRMINKVSNDGGNLIRDLLDISAAESEGSEVVLTEFNLNGFLKDFLRSYEACFSKKDIQIHFKALSGDMILNSDRDFLTRIMDNMVSNAVKFSPAGKNVYVSSEVVGDQVLISVKDEGPGISEEDKKKMFRKFQKLSARPTMGESSTGLGLSIIKSLVERLGGSVRVRSELGKGTTFTVSLPRQ